MACILLVDDDASDLLLGEVILRHAGHEVLSASGGERALRRVLDESVDLVITDLQMPDVHGLELITILGELVPRPPVVAISGHGEFQLHLAREMGADATLQKPVDPERLLQVVEDVLKGQDS